MEPRIVLAETLTEFPIYERCSILESLNRPADAELSLARARVEPGVATAWHAVEGITERYLVTSGRGRVEVGDLPPADVGPGDVVLIPPGVRQRIANVGDADLCFYCICTPPFEAHRYVDLEGEEPVRRDARTGRALDGEGAP